MDFARGLGTLEQRSTRLSLSAALLPRKGGRGVFGSLGLRAAEAGRPEWRRLGYGARSELARAVVRTFVELSQPAGRFRGAVGIERVMQAPSDRLALKLRQRPRGGGETRAELRLGF